MVDVPQGKKEDKPIEAAKDPNEGSKIGEKPEGEIISDKPGLSWSKMQETIDRLNEVRRELQDMKKDFLVIFGIFASFVTFLSIEIQIFKIITDFRLLLGLSSFLIAGILLFAFALNNITKDRDNWKSFLSPVFVLICIFFVISIFFFGIYIYK